MPDSQQCPDNLYLINYVKDLVFFSRLKSVQFILDLTKDLVIPFMNETNHSINGGSLKIRVQSL